jgi:CubicO group peptidase (beta-lactamase class C family)
MKNNLSGGRRTACAAFLMLLCVAAAAGAAVPKTDPALKKALADFSAFYAQALKETGIAGSSFMLDHGGRILLEEYHGLANIEKSQPVDRDTIYHWASITKTFTGIAIMQLRDRGLLKLEDPVISISRTVEVHPFGVMSRSDRPAVIHTAGFGERSGWKDKPAAARAPALGTARGDVPPRVEFKPANGAVDPHRLSGRITELLTTDDYEVYVTEIFRPLEMYRSYSMPRLSPA